MSFTDSTKPVAPNPAAKTSSADYPVEQADLVSQQQRLRKAAAAGVDALKTPISSVMSRLSSPPEAMPQKSQELPAQATPKLSQARGSSQSPGTPDAEEKAFLDACRETERDTIHQFSKTILLLTSGAFAVSFIFLKDVIKPVEPANKGCLIAAWVFWSAAMLFELWSGYARHLAARQAQKLFRSGLRGQELADACIMEKMTRRLTPLAGVWFMTGLILITVFVATNLTGENKGGISTGSTNAIPAALSTNGTAVPSDVGNSTSSTAEQIPSP